MVDGWITEVGRPTTERASGRPATLIAVRAERALFAGELFTTTVLWGVLVAAATAVVGLSVGARAIRRASS